MRSMGSARRRATATILRLCVTSHELEGVFCGLPSLARHPHLGATAELPLQQALGPGRLAQFEKIGLLPGFNVDRYIK